MKLKQAFLNLLKNAFEATVKAGCVSLSARKYLDQLIIRISDDGCGMTPEAAAELLPHLLPVRPAEPVLVWQLPRKL